MASRPRKKMDVAERAKQFVPFAALKGLPEALAKRERIAIPRVELSEDMADDLDRKIRAVERGSMITVLFYCAGEYRKLAGRVARVDIVNGIFQVEEVEIAFENILDVGLIGQGAERG